MPEAISLTATPGGLQVRTPYDAAFLAAFKARVPHAARTWQKPYWIVDPAYGRAVADLVATFFGQQVQLPSQAVPAVAETRIVELRYLGRCKDRGDGVTSAYGTTDGTTWSIVMPEPVLRQWFGAQQQRTDRETLYSVLGIAETADAAGVKQAYRRLARQWHPDVCREPDATTRFQALQHAYGILSDSQTRRKYDAGLALEAQSASLQRGAAGWDNAASMEYRAPLRCGLVLCEGTAKLGRFVVSKICDWQDIVDARGRTLVSSWDTSIDAIKMEWV